ncbi:HPP family protein [Acidocella sp.]|uniref:HPP family protein n=1 Tax=Acidocella sp. TaxID=50710 RepID=UPI002614665F|nr:HPP family protein [Acidocella sp.]
MSVWRRFLPTQQPVVWRDALRGGVGACVGLVLTGLLSRLWLGHGGLAPALIAPIGASAVLVFGVPASPLTQPWAVLGGNVVGALAGVSAGLLIGQPVYAGAVAVGVALVAMAALRCVHPPGGAVALLAALGGPHIAALGYGYVWSPVVLNSLLLVAVALIYHRATGRAYPHRAHASLHPHPAPVPLVLTAGDLDEVLADYGETVDISRDDLEALFQELLGRVQMRADIVPPPRRAGMDTNGAGTETKRGLIALTGWRA